MRSQTLTALSLSLLLCACAADTGNELGNAVPDQANGIAGPGGNAGAPGEPSPPQQPGNGGEAPDPSGEVTLSAAPAQTTEGATMTLTLRNGSRQQIGYNLCTSALETSAGNSVPTNRVCTMELRMLEPGSNADYRYELPVNMADGSYRFVTQLEWTQSGRRSGVRSNGFEVR